MIFNETASRCEPNYGRGAASSITCEPHRKAVCMMPQAIPSVTEGSHEGLFNLSVLAV